MILSTTYCVSNSWAGSSSKTQLQKHENITVYSNLAYVAHGHERQKLDLYLPNNKTLLPLIIWVHGGAFRAGNKDNAPLEFVQAGYAVASINYRLSQHALFPAQIEDVKKAVRWLRANATTYHLNPKRFAAWGGSAGGHLVAMLGTTGGMKIFETDAHAGVSSQVQAVVDYYGPTDFLQMDAQSLPDSLNHNAPDSPESALIGGPIQQNKAQVAKANPITYVSDKTPPFLIVHGDKDKLVPYQQSLLLKSALDKAGVEASLYLVKDGGHGNFKDPKVAELTKEFFDRHLKPVNN